MIRELVCSSSRLCTRLYQSYAPCQKALPSPWISWARRLVCRMNELWWFSGGCCCVRSGGRKRVERAFGVVGFEGSELQNPFCSSVGRFSTPVDDIFISGYSESQDTKSSFAAFCLSSIKTTLDKYLLSASTNQSLQVAVVSPGDRGQVLCSARIGLSRRIGGSGSYRRSYSTNQCCSVRTYMDYTG